MESYFASVETNACAPTISVRKARNAAYRTPSIEDVHRARDDEDHHDVGDQRLGGQQALCPARQRHGVRRAEGDRVGERHVEVVTQPRAPTGAWDGVLREPEVGVGPAALGALERAALVEQPEEQAEGDDVREPDDRPMREQVAGAEAVRAAGR
jgi:hypothetical protein